MTKTMFKGAAVILIAAGVLTIVTAAALSRRSRPAHSGGSSGDDKSFIEEKGKLVEHFALTERSGKLFHSSEMGGRVWVVSFFFTSCPASCRDQNNHIQRLHAKWGPRGVRFVSITCDPDIDDTARLRQYAHGFDAHPDEWLFLTGDLLHIRRIGAEVFQVHVEKAGHMDRLTLVDKWGSIRGHFNWHDPLKLAEMEQSLETLLGELEPPQVKADGDQQAAGNSDQHPADTNARQFVETEGAEADVIPDSP